MSIEDKPLRYEIKTGRYEIKTGFADGVIDQTLIEQTYGRAREASRWIVNTRDKAIRDALIAMGWTPPEGPPHA